MLHFRLFPPSMFKLSLFLLTLSCFLAPNTAQSCSPFCVRKEWRRLTLQEQKNFVAAVAQLRSKKPAEYQKFPDTHLSQGSNGIHGTAQFLPWHRYFLIQFEASLRTQAPKICMAFWDATLDRTNLPAAPVFSTTAGFGALSRNCVSFTGMTQLMDNNVCVRRTNQRVQRIDPIETLNVLIGSKTFTAFSSSLEGGYHGNVHIALGGDDYIGQMSTYRSPADPIFFLHHCFIDRLWALWQSKDFTNRLTDLSYVTSFWRFENINTFLVNTNIPAKNYMDISTLCYKYEDVIAKPGTRVSRRGLGRKDPPPPPPPTYAPPPPPPPPVLPNTDDTETVKNGELDLGEVGELVQLEPLPDFWIDMNNLNKTFVREFEHKRGDIIDQLNHLDGYLSPSARVCNPEFIKGQLHNKRGVKKLVYTVKGERKEVPFQGNNDNSADEVTKSAKSSMHNRRHSRAPPRSSGRGRALELPPPSLSDQLAAIIGEPAFAGTLTPNPFDAVNTD